MKNNKRIIIIISIISISMLLFGTTYAMYNKIVNGGNNKLIVGDIYMRYITGQEKNITMIPSETYNANDYYEFEIIGKNTSDKDIVYDISLNHGDDLASPKIRLDDKFLRFRLVSVENNVETEIFSEDSYDEINNTRIHVGRIENNTTEEIRITYRLYVWVNGLIVGNVNQDYTMEEWPNVYANIKISVTGDFTEKIISDRVTVTFDANGGTTPISSKRVSVNGTYGNLPTPTKSGYTFIGWNFLPDEYQEMEYVKFDGSQYIDLGLQPTNHELEIKFDFEEYATEALFGTNQGYGYYSFISYDNKYDIGLSKNEVYLGNWTSGEHTLLFNGDNNAVILDGETLTSGTNISSTSNLLLAKRGSASNLKGKIYYVKIKDKTTGNLERNLIPCYRKTDNKVGFYDLIYNVFYTQSNGKNFEKNNNTIKYINSETMVETKKNHTLYANWGKNYTVTFDANGGQTSISSKEVHEGGTYGDLPTPTKSGYTFFGWSLDNISYNSNFFNNYIRLEYIIFDGSQYIDLGLQPTNHELEIKFDFEEYATEALFGTNQGYGYYSFISYNNKYDIGLSGNQVYLGNWTSGEHTLLFNGDNNAVILDGETLTSGTNISSTSNLLLAKRGAASNLKGKIYYVKIKDKTTGNLERNLIPCYRKTDNKVGFYDLIYNVFYTQSGGNNFENNNNIIKYINSETMVETKKNHTLYAIWEEE